MTDPPPAPASVARTSSIDTPPVTGHSSVEPSLDSQPLTAHSIAVLPFDNLSGDPEQEYFSDGITDSIILNLSLFPGLQVKSRNSSFAFKQQIKSLGEISKELNVDYIVEGSVRKSADRIRVSAELIDSQSEQICWSEHYDRDLDMLKLCPVLPNWCYLIGGEIEQISGNLDQAIRSYQQGIEVEPDSPLCRFYLIDAMMEQGDEARAKILANEIRALDKTVTGKGLVRSISKDKSIRDRFQAHLEKFDLY